MVAMVVYAQAVLVTGTAKTVETPTAAVRTIVAMLRSVPCVLIIPGDGPVVQVAVQVVVQVVQLNLLR